MTRAPALVVKLGGSLFDGALFPRWLQALAEQAAGRAVLVCGGGAFADAVRAAQARWRFDDLAAHNMAVLALMQGAQMAQAIEPRLVRADDDAAIGAALAAGRVPVWWPWSWLRPAAGDGTDWTNTSDSIACALALRLGAPRLALVKACDAATLARHASLDALAAAGIVDTRLPRLAAGGALAVELWAATGFERLAAALDHDRARDNDHTHPHAPAPHRRAP